jgi:hypothetical protein
MRTLTTPKIGRREPTRGLSMSLLAIPFNATAKSSNSPCTGGGAARQRIVCHQNQAWARPANRRCASRTLLRDPRRRSRTTRLTAAWSTTRSRAEADRSSFSLQLPCCAKTRPKPDSRAENGDGSRRRRFRARQGTRAFSRQSACLPVEVVLSQVSSCGTGACCG